MSKAWPEVKLGEILQKSQNWIELDPQQEYKEVTVRLWGKGVTLRGIVTGSQIAGNRRLQVYPKQFILSRIDARNGAFGLIPNELEGAIVSNDFPVFEIDKSKLSPEYLHWLSKTKTFVESCKIVSEGTTNRVRLKEDKFIQIAIPLPPLAEQKRIVAKIERLAGKIEEVRTIRNQAIEKAQTLYGCQLAFSMTPHREGWKRETVADVIISMNAGWSPQCDDFPAVDGEWGVLKTTAVQWCEFQPYQNKALPPSLKPIPELAVKEGDVLVTRAGPRKRVGVVAAVRRDEPRLTISDKLIRLQTDRTKIEPRFLELSLASPFSQEHLVQRKTGLADAQVNISQAILRATPVAYPPIPEQLQIIEELNTLRTKVDALKHLQTQITAELDAMLPAILDKAFKGEL